MLLKSLEMQGFKSFPDKTKLEFHDGVTAVVGPNGSGKSNISDAIRWVLGETSSKNLRGSKMEDVIFVGTQDRKAQGFAQVALSFDNTERILDWDSDEVIVCRKYYRSTESEYYINGKAVLLKDIKGLFMDTGLGKDGYSIIGQGRIDEIVSVKSSERRDIFEEAAGISKFRYRKAESERKLSQAEENLVRLRDILGELGARVGPLREQSKKAKEFLELSEKKKVFEISIWCYTLDSSKQKLREWDDKFILAKQAYEQAKKIIDDVENQIQHIYELIQQSQISVERLRKEKEQNERENSEKAARIAVLNNDIEHYDNDLNRLEKEIETFQSTSDKIEEETQLKKNEISSLEKASLKLEEEIAEAEQALMETSRKQDSVGSTYDELNKSLNKLVLGRSKSKMNLSVFKEHLNNNKIQLEQIENEKVQSDNDMDALVEEYEQVVDLLEGIKSKKEGLVNTRNGYLIKLDSRRKKLGEMLDYLSKLNSAITEKAQRVKILNDLESSLEGFAFSVKSVIKEGKRGNITGVHGTVAQLIELPPDYSLAIETALGGALQNIIVENEKSAKRAIRFLQDNKAGRATFLPMTSVKGNPLNYQGLDQMDGFIGMASDLISYDPQYNGIMVQLLGRTAIVEDIDYAVAIAGKCMYRFKIVTLDGQVVNAGGSMTGGSQNKATGLLNRKNDIKQLNEEIKQLTEKGAGYFDTKVSLEEQTAQLKAKIQGIDSELTVLNEDNIRFEGEQKRLAQQIDQNKQRLLGHKKSLEEITEKISRLEHTIEQTSSELEQLEQRAKDEEQRLAGLESSTSDLSQRRKELDESINQKRIQKAEQMKELENSESVLRDLEQRSEDNSEKISILFESVEKNKQEILNIQNKVEQLKIEQVNFAEIQQKISAEIQQGIADNNALELKNNKLRKEQQENNSQKEKAGQELARLDERKVSLQNEYDNVISRMWDEYQVTPGEAREMALEIDSQTQIQKDLNIVKSKIKNLGNVNVGAIEEYKEVSERFEFLKAQIMDAEKSKGELEKLICELTSDMMSMFLDTFGKINQQFKHIFVELFGGGSANLRLDDLDNVLECGIEIQVQPPGKIIKNLSSLSGGEKAFIAIAIYFAILKVSPSPFCVLDEIEAALDDVNVNKYASYLRTIDERTQFIVITHRRGTMEQADMLYGVTMQENGISKLLELNVTEMEQMKEKVV